MVNGNQSSPSLPVLLDMLRYKRPEGSKTQKVFCDRFLAPVFGDPDMHGNYHLVVGPAKPTVVFMSHHDTVHSVDGMQTLTVKGDLAMLSRKSKKNSNCLGADCTTGVWLMLYMIEMGVPGRYVVHAGEERGGIGATAIVNDQSMTWVDQADVALSFDRYGTKSIVTHQCSARTASEEFGDSLANILDMGHVNDSFGVFTDSEVYASAIPECTNLSVGYIGHHTNEETQDLVYAYELAVSLVEADWTQLVIARDHTIMEMDSGSGWGRWADSSTGYETYYGGQSGLHRSAMVNLVEDHPAAIADMLEQLGYDACDIQDYLLKDTSGGDTRYAM